MSTALLLLFLGASVREPALVKDFRVQASRIAESGELDKGPGLDLLSAYDKAGRPHGYIDAWRERRQVYRALAKAAAYRGLQSLSVSLARYGGWGPDRLPQASNALPDSGSTIRAGPLPEILLAWPFVGAQYQGKTLLGTPWSRLRPEAGDAIMGRGFGRIGLDPQTGELHLGRMVNPWGFQEALGAFSLYTPAALKFTLGVRGTGETEIFLNDRWRKAGVWTPLSRGWHTILLRFKPPEPGPLKPDTLWKVSLKWEEDAPGFLWPGSPKPSWDEMTGYLAWAQGQDVLGHAGSQRKTARDGFAVLHKGHGIRDELARILLSFPGLEAASASLSRWTPWGPKLRAALASAWSGRPSKAAGQMAKILEAGEIPKEAEPIVQEFRKRWGREPKPKKKFSLSKVEAMAQEGKGWDVLAALPWWPGARIFAGHKLEQNDNFVEAGRLLFEASAGLEKTSWGGYFWSKGLSLQGMNRPVQVRGRKADYSVLHDGWLDTAQEFSKGPKSVVLDLGVVTKVNRLVIVMAKGPGIRDLVVEGSRDGGFYGLLGEFFGELEGHLDLSLDEGMKVRTLRLKFVVPDQPHPLRIQECLVGFR